jgi:threonylcarbamoyladenosine tRNA methylthiotransferase MtaB
VIQEGKSKMVNKIVTFGCRLNIYESQLIKQAIDESPDNNLIVFNSCAVTSNAEKELRQAIKKASKENPEAKIIVTGCAAQISPEKYAKMPEVGFVIGNVEKTDPKIYQNLFASHHHDHLTAKEDNRYLGNEDPEIRHKDQIFFANQKSQNPFLKAEESEKILVNDIMSVKETANFMVLGFENRTRAFVQVQNGCNHRCTFCTIPYGRGNSRSVALGEIVAQIKQLVTAGHKEIVITGVDISDYGKDLALPITLSQMIKRVLKLVPDLPRIRLSSIDVAEIDEEMIDLITNEPRFMPYLHISVQSGDDTILKRMKRRHSRDQVVEFCNRLRKLRPEVTFGADFIAGFPTETDEMFQNSVNLIKEAGIIFNHVFPFSKRSGTPAAKMPQIEGKIIKQRAKILRQAGAEELQKFLDQQIGKKMTVMVENNNLAKSENFLDVKIENDSKITSGDILEVKIISKNDNNLMARISI